MRVKPYYKESDIMAKDYLTFLRILKECEAIENKALNSK